MGELVDDVEHPEPPSVVGAIFDEVVGPHMIAMHQAAAGCTSCPSAIVARVWAVGEEL